MSLSVSYDLSVSAEAQARKQPPDTSAEKSFSYAIAEPTSRTIAEVDTSNRYYAALSKALKDATKDVGDRLTEWRDVVGSDEKEKERTVAAMAQARKAADDSEDDDQPE
ncbi:hypothetical protein DL93DRAFT_2078377 [Clavulina sp. PMI_390]|nr:hypothetical protein DL93DRAFT_2078377 [Clavulina sp. PMI_390]